MANNILVTRSSMPDFEEYANEIKDIWESRWLTNMGVKHQELQRNLIEYMDVDGLELLVNGHFALEISLQALNLSGEVITTPFTFISTTHAIVRNGLTPVFCDIDPVTYCMDVNKIEELITDKTCAIMPVHVYGHICDVESIQKIADKYGLKVIYDAAHAFGVRYKNKGVGSFGDVSCYSFHATKVFNSVEGGCACFHDEDFGKRLYKLKNFGISDPETVDGVGVNAKMNEFCAAMGLCNLRHVESEMGKRRIVVERYREHLENIEGIQLSPIQKDVRQNYAYFPVVFDENIFGTGRDEVMEMLAEIGVGARKYFYPLTSGFDCFHGKYNVMDTPIAFYTSQRVLTLPLYADLSLENVDLICEKILECRR